MRFAFKACLVLALVCAGGTVAKKPIHPAAKHDRKELTEKKVSQGKVLKAPLKGGARQKAPELPYVKADTILEAALKRQQAQKTAKPVLKNKKVHKDRKAVAPPKLAKASPKDVLIKKMKATRPKKGERNGKLLRGVFVQYKVERGSSGFMEKKAEAGSDKKKKKHHHKKRKKKEPKGKHHHMKKLKDQRRHEEENHTVEGFFDGLAASLTAPESHHSFVQLFATKKGPKTHKPTLTSKRRMMLALETKAKRALERQKRIPKSQRYSTGIPKTNRSAKKKTQKRRDRSSL